MPVGGQLGLEALALRNLAGGLGFGVGAAIGDLVTGDIGPGEAQGFADPGCARALDGPEGQVSRRRRGSKEGLELLRGERAAWLRFRQKSNLLVPAWLLFFCAPVGGLVDSQESASAENSILLLARSPSVLVFGVDLGVSSAAPLAACGCY